MTHLMKWIGFLATLSIVLVIPVYTFIEPAQQAERLDAFHIQAVTAATDLYAENCAVCHGASGEGIADNPPLNVDTVRDMAAAGIAKTIARGRTSTLMAPWAVEEGGVFTSAQVDDLVTLIQLGNWAYIEQRVAALGLIPPEVIKFDVSEEMLASLSALPGGDSLGQGLEVFAANCAACHNANGSGTLIAPAIDSPDLRAKPFEEISKTITSGVPGTLMAGWEHTLSSDEINTVIDLIYRWPEVIQSGIDFPETEMASFPASPEMAADGERLFEIACTGCHGVEGYGSPMAPALNNQIFLAETPDAAIYQIIAGGVPDTLMPAWGSRLTDYDIQTIVAYLRGFEPSAPPIVSPVLNP